MVGREPETRRMRAPFGAPFGASSGRGATVFQERLGADSGRPNRIV